MYTLCSKTINSIIFYLRCVNLDLRGFIDGQPAGVLPQQQGGLLWPGRQDQDVPAAVEQTQADLYRL